MTAIEGAGTPEAVWQAWPALGTWPQLDLSSVPARVVVVAPHPDDEVLGVGGLLAMLQRAGSSITVVAVTDGDASHPGSPTLSPAELVTRRADERAAALAVLGLDGATVEQYRLPDGGVPGAERVVTERLVDLLQPTDWCLATWRGDGHPDHEATGRAAAAAAERVGSRLLEFPVWTWHWARPEDDRVPWTRARRIVLPDDLVEAKRAAAAEYRTQVYPLSDDTADAAILPPGVLERLLRETETVFA